MRFSEILSKMVDGQTLSVEEKQTIVQEARRMEENSALLSSIVKPGTKILVLDGVDVTDANVINANIIDAKIVSARPLRSNLKQSFLPASGVAKHHQSCALRP